MAADIVDVKPWNIRTKFLDTVAQVSGLVNSYPDGTKSLKIPLVGLVVVETLRGSASLNIPRRCSTVVF